MYDIFHEWGSDLVVGSGGDLALATGSAIVSQRVRRRLLTNPGDYLWNLDKGADWPNSWAYPLNRQTSNQ
jgi:hypothetical protein